MNKIYCALGVAIFGYLAVSIPMSYIKPYNAYMDKQAEITSAINNYDEDARKSIDSDGFKWLSEKGLTYPGAARKAINFLEESKHYAERDAYFVRVLTQYQDHQKWDIFDWNQPLLDSLWKFDNGVTPKTTFDPTGERNSLASLAPEQVEKLKRCYAFLKNRYTVESPAFGPMIDLHDKTRSPECEL
jgi:hypothetical protein